MTRKTAKHNPAKILDDIASLNTGACFLIALLLTLFIGLVDYIKVYPISVSAFYVFPVALLAWKANKKALYIFIFITAFVRATIYFIIMRQDLLGISIYIYNLIISILLYLFIAVVVLKLRDMYEQEKSRARIDHVTGISNWQGFSEAMEKVSEECKVLNQSITIVYIDCDNFKWVNDNMGHAYGDIALQEVAKTLKENVRKTDIVARLGGDEFALILCFTVPEEAAEFVKKINTLLLEKMKEHNFPITFSIGIASFLYPLESYHEMLKLADNLMYQVKKANKNSIKQEIFKTLPSLDSA